MPDPFRRVASARTIIGQLRRLMFNDLDEEKGGFRWWHGHLDQERVIFASDYLLQISGQVGNWLLLAARHEIEFNEAWYAETTWLRQNEGKGVDPFPLRGDLEHRRNQRIDAAIIGFFHACGSALDALASTAIGVLGLRADLVTASWPKLTKAATGDDREKNQILAPLGTEARTLQEAALAAIVQQLDQGPHGWLSWTLSMRHTLVHRAHRFQLRRFYRVSRRGPLEYALHLPKDPQLTDAEAFVLADDLEGLLLWEHAGSTIAGVLDQLVLVISTAFATMHTAWQQRRARPDLVRQAVEQWRHLYPSKRDLSGFAGFGPRLDSAEGEIRVDSEVARRFRAARIMDADRPYWWRAFADKER